MIKKLLILHFCLVIFLTHPMKEDDRNQNNENTNQNNSEQNRIENSDQNKKLLIQFINTDKPVYIEIPNTLAEKIPLINFSSSGNTLKIPYGKKTFNNVIEIVKICPFNNENEKIKMAYNYFKQNKTVNKIKDFHKIKNFNEDSANFSYGKNIFSQNKNSDLDKKLYTYNQQKKSETIELNNNIASIEKIFEHQPLLERIETLLLADFLKLPSTLTDDIIYGLNIKTMSYNDLMSIKKHNNDKNLCKKIAKTLVLKKNYSNKKLSLSYAPHAISKIDFENNNSEEYDEFQRKYSIQFSPQGECIAFALKGQFLNLWNYKKKKTDYIKFDEESHVINLAFNNSGTTLGVKTSISNHIDISLWDMAIENEILRKNNKKEKCLFKDKFTSGDIVFGKDDNHLYSAGKTQKQNSCIIENNEKSCETKIFCQTNKHNNDDNFSFSQIEHLENRIAGTVYNGIFIYNLDGTLKKMIKTEYSYDDNQNVDTDKTPIDRHNSFINALRHNSSKKIFASASNDKTIILWSDNYYNFIGKLKGHNAEVTDIAFSPDGKTIVSTSLDKTIKFWNTETGTCTTTLECEEPPIAVAFNYDGTLICTASNNANVNLISFGTSENLSLQEMLLLMYCQEKKGKVSSQYKDLYKKLPKVIKKQIDKPQWLDIKKEEKIDTLKLFNFEKKNNK